MPLPECDLGPMIGELRTFRMVEVRSRADRMETFKSALWVVIGVIYAVIFLAVVLGGLLIYSTAAKAANVPVLPECVELAQREGFPTDFLTRLQQARARLRMARLSDKDPLVKACREAIRAARATNPTGGPP
jgi:uncharacterized membrane protein